MAKLIIAILLFSTVAFGGEIWGRVTSKGRGIANVRVTAWNANTTETQAPAMTNLFGYYRMAVPGCGFTYLVYADSRRYVFADSPRTAFFLDDEDGIIELNFEAWR